MIDLPGYQKVEGIEVSYIQISQSDDFDKVTTFIKPFLPKSGGVSEDGCYVIMHFQNRSAKKSICFP